MSKDKVKETILVLSAALAGASLIFHDERLVYGSLTLSFIGIFFSGLSRYIALGWMKLAEGLGFVTSKVLLTVIFYVFLFPISLLSKLFGAKSGVQSRVNKSIYTERNHAYVPADFEKMW